MSKDEHRPRRWRQVAKWLALSTVVLITLAAASGAAANYLAIRHYRARYPAPGAIYIVDGYKMHLYCTGSGAPTIVLDSGLGDDFLVWGRVQPELAKLTRVCSYDRAGLGWSEPQPGVRDSNAIAYQLHSLLLQAAISGPIVLMGHSASGLHIRAYASRYPNQIAGLVFVDGATPEQSLKLPPSVQRFVQQSFNDLKFLKWTSALGIRRVLGNCGSAPPGFEAYAGLLQADDCIPSVIEAVRQEADALEPSCREVAPTGPFPNLPILIFSQDPDNKNPEIPANIRADMASPWNSLQEGLKNLSPKSRRIIAKGSSHYIQIERPEVLNKEVGQFILQIRGTAPQPTDYGSTITE